MKSVPKKSVIIDSHQLHVRIPVSFLPPMRVKAAEAGKSVAGWVRRLIEREVAGGKKKDS